MGNFKYKVSVIIPIYNVEEYLRDCFESLLAQTIDHSQMEVLLINDGSTDNSLNICYEYAQSHFIFKVFSQENSGVSAARNLGIRNAQGKYLFYLDADDTYTDCTLKEVSDFFDTIYDEVDIVAYKRDELLNGKSTEENYRYNYLKNDGIYDTDEYPFICITTLSIAVKNKLEKNKLFNVKYNFGEDTEYINELIHNNKKVGYCSRGKYNYVMQRDGGAVNLSNFNSITQKIEQFENALKKNNNPSRYFQALVFSDLNWLLRTNRLFPYHLDEDDIDDFNNRLRNIVYSISDDIILSHPNCDDFHKSYWLRQWKNETATIISSKQNVQIFLEDKCIYNKSDIDMIYHKIHIDEKTNSAYIYGFIKSKIYCYIEEAPKLYARINKNPNQMIKVDVKESVFSFYKTRTKTNNFWGYKFIFSLDEVTDVEFFVELDSVMYPTNYWFMPTSIIDPRNNREKIIHKDYLIQYKDRVFSFVKICNDYESLRIENEKKFYGETVTTRNNIIKLKESQKNIWIYSDEATVLFDNAYYQFIHDFEKNDGVERYYIYGKAYSEIKELFQEKHIPYLVRFGSDKHKLLFAASKYVITSFWADNEVSPFSNNERRSLIDLFEFDVIYLQHGILHAKLPLIYHSERCHADKIVVSSDFEVHNFIENYQYDINDLIKTGMPRFDHILINNPSNLSIIFAPSWRSYLETRPSGETEWQLAPKKFLKSNYFKNIKALIESPVLISFLESNNICFDLKLHPIATVMLDYFEIKSDRIRILTEKNDLTNYSLFITDFSSYVFDYAYLQRPIMYFVPDYFEFISGMNHYRELDLPFEKAFGKLVTTPEAAVDEIIRIADKKFAVDPIFKERMEKFFIPMNNCSEQIYQTLSKL